MEWISLKDQRPQFDMKVLVFASDETDNIEVLSLVKVTECKDSITYDFQDKNGDDYYKDVTHWMPLPKKPTK